MGQCPFTVELEGKGLAMVKVTRPDGRIEKGKASKKGDLFKIQAGIERYEIPEAVVFGG
jgi:hypothetical protein